MPYKTSPLKMPGVDTVVWRYMDFAKFVWILHRKQLYFSSVKALAKTDAFEGQLAIANHFLAHGIAASQSHEQKIEALRKTGIVLDGMLNNPAFAKFVDDAFNSYPLIAQQMAGSVGSRTAISCWHMSEGESWLMWQAYLQHGLGVAIATSIGNLIDAVRAAKIPVVMGKVEYLTDDELGHTGKLQRHFWKRAQYAGEREFRMAVQFEEDECQDIGDGTAIDIYLEPLLQNVVAPPSAPDWFIEMISSLLRRQKLESVIVERSRLSRREFEQIQNQRPSS